MGPQKSRELYRVDAYGSNQLSFKAQGEDRAQFLGLFGVASLAVFAGVNFVMR